MPVLAGSYGRAASRTGGTALSAGGWGSPQGHPGTSTATQCRGGDLCIPSTGTPHPETFSLGWGHPSSIPLELFHIPPLHLSSIFPALPNHPSTASTQNPPIIPPNSLWCPLQHPSPSSQCPPSAGLTLKSRNAAIQQLRLCSSSLQSSFRPFTPLRTLWGCGRGRSRHGAAPAGSEGTESPWQGEEQGMTPPQAGTSPP